MSVERRETKLESERRTYRMEVFKDLCVASVGADGSGGTLIFPEGLRRRAWDLSGDLTAIAYRDDDTPVAAYRKSEKERELPVAVASVAEAVEEEVVPREI